MDEILNLIESVSEGFPSYIWCTQRFTMVAECSIIEKDISEHKDGDDLSFQIFLGKCRKITRTFIFLLLTFLSFL